MKESHGTPIWIPYSGKSIIINMIQDTPFWNPIHIGSFVASWLSHSSAALKVLGLILGLGTFSKMSFISKLSAAAWQVCHSHVT